MGCPHRQLCEAFCNVELRWFGKKGSGKSGDSKFKSGIPDDNRGCMYMSVCVSR